MVCPLIGTAVLGRVDTNLYHPSMAQSVVAAAVIRHFLSSTFLSMRKVNINSWSRFGDTPVKFQVVCPKLSRKRDCSPKRVNTSDALLIVALLVCDAGVSHKLSTCCAFTVMLLPITGIIQS